MLLFFCIFIFLAFSCQSAIGLHSPFPNLISFSIGSTFTSYDGKFTLSYALTPNGNEIQFNMSAQTLGWVGFGWTEGTLVHVASSLIDFFKMIMIYIVFFFERYVCGLCGWNNNDSVGYVVKFRIAAYPKFG